MFKRNLENVKREFRNLKTGQHENTRENVEEKMTADERTTHERTGHATYDPKMRNVCQRIQEKQLQKLHTSTMQQ